MQPARADDGGLLGLDLDDPLFSSTQQLDSEPGDAQLCFLLVLTKRQHSACAFDAGEAEHAAPAPQRVSRRQRAQRVRQAQTGLRLVVLSRQLVCSS